MMRDSDWSMSLFTILFRVDLVQVWNFRQGSHVLRRFAFPLWLFISFPRVCLVISACESESMITLPGMIEASCSADSKVHGSLG
jgi:hypothetical protein